MKFNPMMCRIKYFVFLFGTKFLHFLFQTLRRQKIEIKNLQVLLISVLEKIGLRWPENP